MVNFSFIIPHYDLSSNLLRRCLDSIPHNDDVQIIVVDDHTPSLYDDNNNLIEAKKLEFVGYGERYTEILFLDKNQGPGNARNEGLKLAKGKWVLFCDADDYYLTDKLTSLLEIANTSECDVIWFSEDDYFYGHKPEEGQFFLCSEDIKLDFLITSSPCNKIIRKNFLDENNIEFESSSYGEDQLFSAKVVCESKCPGFYASHVYYYDRRDGSLSKTEDLQKLRQGYESEIKYNLYLKSKGVLSLKHRNIFLGGLLYRIYLKSPWIYRLLCIKEFFALGREIAWADYKQSCIQRNIRPNFWYQLTDPIRVKIGSILHK